jgi:hypothetical protein
MGESFNSVFLNVSTLEYFFVAKVLKIILKGNEFYELHIHVFGLPLGTSFLPESFDRVCYLQH